MKPYIVINNIHVPTYGTIAILSILAANIIALIQCIFHHNDFDLLFGLELYGGAGAIIGAKLLSMWQANASFLSSGFSVLGGIAGGSACIWLCSRRTEIPVADYILQYGYLIPLVHALWKVGCFCGGCCFGIVYHGFFSVMFPHDSAAPAGVPLFPSQLAESIFCFAISVWMFLQKKEKNGKILYLKYITMYCAGRAILEPLRFHSTQRSWSAIWISVILASVSAMYIHRIQRIPAAQKEN